MAIVNRDLDQSQQTSVLSACLVGTATGRTYVLAQIPYPAQLISAQQVVSGLSGAPNHSLWLQRFVVGSGITSIALGMSMASVTVATSGPQGFTVISGLTNLFQSGDMLMLSTAASNTGAENATVTFVIKALQDIKTAFGV